MVEGFPRPRNCPRPPPNGRRSRKCTCTHCTHTIATLHREESDSGQRRGTLWHARGCSAHTAIAHASRAHRRKVGTQPSSPGAQAQSRG